MISETSFVTLALSFPHTEEAPHHDRMAFKLVGKRIFATLHRPSSSANLKLSPTDQTGYCEMSSSIYPVPNKWGEQGWTTFELQGCPEDVLKSALETAYLLAKGK